MADLLLINPPSPQGGIKYPPLGLIWLASFLRQEGYTVDVLDAWALEMNEQEIIKYIRKSCPLVCGITFMTVQFGYVIQLIREIKKQFPNIIVIAGGVHISTVPKDFLQKCPEVDYVIIGEGEYTLKELLACLKNGESTDNIRGLGFNHNNNQIINPVRPLITDLNTLPMPAWDLLPINLYEVVTPEREAHHMAGVSLSISSQRGCPFKCIFCASGSVFGKSFRSRSPRLTVQEIEYLNKKYGISTFFFPDEVPTLKEKYIMELCNGIIDRGLDIRWSCNSRCNAPGLNPKTIKRMKEAGCAGLDLGCESGSPEVLKFIKKQITLHDIYQAHKWTHNEGLYTATLMMCAHPYETITDFKSSLRLITYLESESPAFDASTPFPGTGLYDIALKKGWLRTDDWSEYFIGNPNPVMRTENFDYKDVRTIAMYGIFVGKIIRQLSNYKRHTSSKNFYKLLKIFIRIIFNFKDKLPLSHRIIWIKLFIIKHRQQKYFNQILESLPIRTRGEENDDFGGFWDKIVAGLKDLQRPKCLILNPEGVKGVKNLLQKINELYSGSCSIYVAESNFNWEQFSPNIQSNITVFSKWTSVLIKKYDIIFHFQKSTNLLALLQTVSKSIILQRFRNKQYLVSPNLRFWKISIKNMFRTIMGGESPLAILQYAFLPITILYLLYLSIRTKEFDIQEQIIPQVDMEKMDVIQ